MKRGKNIDALSRLFVNAANVGMGDLIASFNRMQRTLLRDADIEEEGRIRVVTVSGADLASATVLDALQKRTEQRSTQISKKRKASADKTPD